MYFMSWVSSAHWFFRHGVFRTRGSELRTAMHSPSGDEKKGRAAYKCSKCGKSKKGHTCEVGSSLVFHSTVHDVQHSKTKQQLEKAMRELEGAVTRLQQENAVLRCRLKELGFVQGDNLPLGSYGVNYNGMSYQAYGSYQGSYNYDPPPETLLGTYPATDASEPHLLTTYSQNHPEILGSGYANSGHVAYADGHSTYQQETEHHLLNPYSAAVSLDPRDIPYSLPQGELLSNYNIQSDHR